MNQFGGRLAGLCAVIIAIFILVLSGCGGGATTPARTDSGSSSGGNPTKTPTSNTAAAPHTLTVQASPATGGKLSSNPAGISCGSTCSGSFVSGTNVAITVSPAAGFVFTGWGGACSGTGGCIVSMNNDQNVVANFGPAPKPQSNLSIAVNGSGAGTVTSAPAGINCGATCSAAFNQGSAVVLTPVAAAGSAFAGWSGAACTGTGNCSLTLTADTSLTATFIPTYSLTTSKAGTGTGAINSSPAGVSCGATCSANFPAGSVISLAATPASGSAFTGWGGACTGTGACTVTLNSNQTVTANFGPPPTQQFNLSVSKAGTGSGTISSAPAGINCGAACTSAFNSGTVITLTAAPSAGSAFAGWSGAACAGTGTCTVTVTADTAVAANFVPLVPVTVTLAGTGSGSVASFPAGIACGSTCTASFASGSVVSLVASPASGSVFSSWGGACSGSGACQVTLASAQSVTATFDPAPPPPPQSALTVVSSGTGTGTVTSNPSGINCGSTCSANFNTGTIVTISASAAAGSVFTGWSGASCAGTSPCPITLNSDTSVTADFVQQVTLTTTLLGAGSGTITSSPAGINCGSTCSAPYASGTSVSLAATPAAGSVFAGWSGACSGTGACSVSLSSPQTVSATFNPAPPPQFTVSVTTSGAGTVTSSPSGVNCGATCSAKFNSGTSVTLTANPAAGSTFAGWSGSACAGTGTCTINVTSDTSVAANFLTLYTLGVSLAGTGSGSVASSPAGINCGSTCSSTFSSGSTVSLAANPAAGSIFSGWSGACSGTGSCVVSMSSNQGVTATFDPAPPPQYAMSILLGGVGSSGGSVVSSDGKISCGGTCSAQYGSGTVVTLGATPASGFSFGGWQSAYCAGTDPCVITITSTQSVTANFVNVQPLFVSVSGPSGAGTVISNPPGIGCPVQCAANYNQGTSVTLTAVPASGFAFNGWSGACTGTGACTVTMNSSQTVNADFTTTKSVATPFLSITPSILDFGSVQAGTTTSQTVQLTNTGPSSGGNLIISSAATDNSLFGIPAGQLPMTIAPGSGQALTITVSPNATGAITGTATFSSNGGNPTVNLPLSANGSTTTTGAAAFIASPTSLFFGNVNVGDTATQTLTISNPGTASTLVSAATISGSGLTIVSPTFPLTLAAGASITVTISFAPQNAGSVTGVITFTSNAPSSPVVSVVASANSSTPSTSATPSPSALTFGSTPLGATYYQNAVLYNTGNTPVIINGATPTGAGFTLSGVSFPITIPVAGSQAFTVAFTPTSPGVSTGILSFSTNAPDPQPSVSLSGTGIFISQQHSATLTWTASTSQVIGYNVYRSTTSGYGYQLLSFTPTTTFVDTTVTAGQTYFWVVTAVSSGGTESVFSNQAAGTIPVP